VVRLAGSIKPGAEIGVDCGIALVPLSGIGGMGFNGVGLNDVGVGWFSKVLTGGVVCTGAGVGAAGDAGGVGPF
jgi:hypothetical protein